MLLDKRRVSTFTKTFAVIIAISFVSSVALYVLPTYTTISNVPANAPANLRKAIEQGNRYSDNKQYKQANEAYERALAIDPNNVDVRIDNAIAYYYQNNVQRAIDEALKGVKVRPNHPKAHYNLGIFYTSAGRPEDARREFETYLKLEPSGSSADYARQQLQQLGK
ncbi:MAG: tetratricopeptide repeat protein [Actinobacteria bacterium]|nr:tetratricopeptide repeat protein [Actinomycetota bacterium]